MKILVVGLEHVGSLGWYIKQALLKMGYQLELFDYRKVAYGSLYTDFLQRFVLGRIAFKVFQREAIKGMNAKLINLARSFNPDLVIVQKGEIILPGSIREINNTLKARTVVWHADSPFSALTSSSNIILGLPEYDLCFVFDPYYIPGMMRAGAKRAEYLPFACDPDVHRTISLTEEERLTYGSDIVFIGTCQNMTNPRRREILRSLSDLDLKIWGQGWEALKRSNLRKRTMGRPVYGEEMVKVLNASRIAINIHHGQSVTGVNMRTFETPACGCFLLTDEIAELSKFFKPDEEVVCYKHVSDLREKLVYYLEHPDEREEIARKGQEKARENHTYIQRMRRLFEIVAEVE